MDETPINGAFEDYYRPVGYRDGGHPDNVRPAVTGKRSIIVIRTHNVAVGIVIR